MEMPRGIRAYQKPENRPNLPSKPKNRNKNRSKRKTAENNRRATAKYRFYIWRIDAKYVDRPDTTPVLFVMHNVTTGPDDVTGRHDPNGLTEVK